MCNNSASIALLSFVMLSGILNLETIKLGFSQPGVGLGCKELERKALLQFKQNLTDPSGWLSSWAGENCCSWRGVSCNDRTGSIIQLKLNNPSRDSYDTFEEDAVTGLGGEISPSLLQLKDLEYLDLSMNNFTGVQVPEFIGSLKELRYLNLSGSFFSGTIPHNLGNLSNLLYLDLNNFLDQSNQIDLGLLSGLTSLKHINLGGADLSKAAAYWFEFFNKLHSLVELHLSNCNLPSLPLNPSLNFTSLQVLDLSNNGFNSSIPHWFFNITGLLILDLSSNDLQGDIPDGFASLNSLQQLDLSRNTFLGGRLSRILGKLCNLQTLSLSLNQISGEVSDFIDGLSECTNSSLLERLELGFNQLTGNLPNSLGYLKNLRYLELWYNYFLGTIPPSIGNLTFLKELYLTSNQMNGIFPESFGKLSELKVVDFSGNQWEGVITEAQFRNLSNLKEFSLDKASANISLIFNISSDWVPPFKLTYIKIRSCQLGPKFPTWLRNQSELQTLVLNNVGISDTIPHWFWQLNLTLDELTVSYNELRGVIPNSLSFHFPATVDLSSNSFQGPLPLWSSNVTKLYLRSNSFSGPIPQDYGQKLPLLTDLDISFNFLNGNIPNSIGYLNQLLTLVISNNNFSGEIPQFWNNVSFLYVLDMSNNSFSGEIPESIGSLHAIRFLILCNNHLSGEVPSSLKNFSFIDSLDLGDNKFSGNIPAWIGDDDMPSLSILRLRSNHFNGTIPYELCKLSDLHILDLSHNNLSGFIPHCLGNLNAMKVEPPDSYQYEGRLQVVVKGSLYAFYTTLYLVNLIDLSSNNLSGEMPVELTNLIHLGTLNLSRNHLVGKIPTQIGKLEWLETFDLSGNKLSGSIPPSMASLRFMNSLNLSYNNLSGEIPRRNQFQTLNDPSIYEGNLALCGDPLPKKCSEIGGTLVPGREEDEEGGDDHDKLWLFLSIALGFITGFWGVYGTLIIKKSWRYAYLQFVDKTKNQFLTFFALNAARLQRKLSEKNGSGQN